MSKELFTENYGASTIERARLLMKKYNIEQAVQIAPDLADFIRVLGQFSKGRELTLMMNFKIPAHNKVSYVMRVSVGNKTAALCCNTANQDMESIHPTYKPVIFGDFKRFAIREVLPLKVIRLDERFADTDETAFAILGRYDSKLLTPSTSEPAVYIRNATT